MSRLPSRLAVLPRAALNSLKKRRRPAQINRVLIAHNLLLGDTLMLTALLARLRAQQPQAGITMTVAPAFAPLYDGRPYGVQVLPFDAHRAATAHRIMQSGPYDLALVPGDNRYAWLAHEGLYAYTSQVPEDMLNALGAVFVLVAAIPVARRLGLAYAVFILINILPPMAAPTTPSWKQEPKETKPEGGGEPEGGKE